MYKQGDTVMLLEDCCTLPICPFKKGTVHIVAFHDPRVDWVDVKVLNSSRTFKIQTYKLTAVKSQPGMSPEYTYETPKELRSTISTAIKCDCNWTDVLRYGCTKHV